MVQNMGMSEQNAGVDYVEKIIRSYEKDTLVEKVKKINSSVAQW